MQRKGDTLQMDHLKSSARVTHQGGERKHTKTASDRKEFSSEAERLSNTSYCTKDLLSLRTEYYAPVSMQGPLSPRCSPRKAHTKKRKNLTPKQMASCQKRPKKWTTNAFFPPQQFFFLPFFFPQKEHFVLTASEANEHTHTTHKPVPAAWIAGKPRVSHECVCLSSKVFSHSCLAQ